MGWLTGWDNRKSVTLSRASGAVTDYQMKLLLGESSGATGEDVDCGGLCQTDFDDIRFTTSDGETLLDYWIESVSGATPNQLATIWIEFNSIGTDATTFYMYYGNAGAAAVSNGPNTFIFFDHFDNDLSNWAGDSGANYASISGSIMSYFNNYNSGVAFHSMYSTITAGRSTFAVRCYGKIKQLVTSHDVIGAQDSGRAHSAFLYNESTTRRVSTKDGTTETLSTSNWTSDTYKIFDICVVAGTKSRFFENGVELTGSPKTSNPANSSAMRAAFGAYRSESIVKADWVLLRNYEDTEPAWGAWGAQEAPPSTFTPRIIMIG